MLVLKHSDLQTIINNHHVTNCDVNHKIIKIQMNAIIRINQNQIHFNLWET